MYNDERTGIPAERKPVPPQRRRRRKRRPKWMRVLRKYWPPIRFALICILLLVLLFNLGKAIINLITGDGKEDPTDPTGSSQVEETTPPTEAEVQVDLKTLLADAEFVAAGYDYEGAIEMLRSSDLYTENAAQIDAKIAAYEAADAKLVTYKPMNEITHVFFHSLIVDNERCFDGDYTEHGYNVYMTTIREFNMILESMYERGYVLVSPYDVAYEVTGEDGKTHFTYGEIRLPEGKKPFIMSQDDVNYYGYMIGDPDPDYERPAVANANGDGFAHKIIIGEDGYPTCEYYDADGNLLVGDYDLVPILEKFIQEHPDFSYKGARAILGMTGYEGVFGYRTKPGHEPYLGTEAYQKEVEAAKEVAQCLRDHGWILASHSYGHPSMGNISVEKVAEDTAKWEATVESIIGECDIILYPNGSDVAGIERYTMDNQKFKVLYDSGLRYFFNVDSSVYWAQLGDSYYRGGRRNLDGFRIYNNPNRLDDLFDAYEVLDPARPTPINY